MLQNGTDRMRRGPLEWLLKNYDTITDKGSWNTNQTLAKLIQLGGMTIHYEISELINSIWNREENTQQ